MLARANFARTAAMLRSSNIIPTATVRGFKELPKPDPTKPVPWRSVVVRDSTDAAIPAINVNVYSTGKAVRPPAPIVCIHGITSNSRYFASLVRELNYPYGVISVDLRGRGDSDKPARGEYGLVKHAEDIIRVLDHFHLTRAFLVGHSMGTFVAYQVAKLFPDRVAGIVIVDSGFYRDPQQTAAAELPAEAKAGVAKAMGRLGREFTSLEDYLEYWFAGKGVTPDSLSVDMLDYYQNELTRTANGLVPKPCLESAQDDAHSISTENVTLSELANIQHPTIMLRAEHGFVDNSPPMITEVVAQNLRTTLNIKKDIVIPGTNHYTILTQPESVKTVARSIDEFVEQYDIYEKINKAFEEVKPKEEDEDEEQQQQQQQQQQQGQPQKQKQKQKK